MTPVFVTGGTGYLGRPLIAALLERGHAVHALVRPGSEAKVPSGARPIVGDALEPSFASAIPADAAIVHLLGTPHPNPSKAAEFQRVDLQSIRATTTAIARHGRVSHVVYVSVAHPAPVMRAYIEVRTQGEALVAATGVPSTILRPWYVLGPGHYWPYMLVPAYEVLKRLPGTRDTANRLGLVTRGAMVAALVKAVTSPPASGVRIVEVPEIAATPH